MNSNNVENPSGADVSLAFPAGHFYSPIVNPADLEPRRESLWPRNPPTLSAIDFGEDEQRAFLKQDVAMYRKEFDYPETAPEGGLAYAFALNNGLFSGMDALSLYTMLRKLRPSRVIEVGSGFSSLLTADVSRRFLGGAVDFTCIEPYPRQMLLDGVPGISRLMIQKVEAVDISVFEALGERDILFIDSSHVAKTGSDVNYLYFEVLPRLAPGVVIHIHDIFFPYDYPQDWVLRQNRSWNEQYLLRAMLMYTDAFQVLFGSAYAYYVFPDLIRSVCDGVLLGGGSFWMRKAR